MNLIFKIAWRNIARHKGKSIVIGVILFLGAFLMTLGNGVITGMNQGLKDNIINSFMGHLVIISEKQKSDNVLFELYGKAVVPIMNFGEIKKSLETDPLIDQFLPVGKNMALALNEESDFAGVFLLGVDFESYRKMFPGNLSLVEGRLLEGGEKGVLVPEFARKEFYNYTNLWFQPENCEIMEKNLTPEAKENRETLKVKREQVFLGSNDENSTTDVRVGVKGIVKYKALNTFWGHFLIIDIDSYRQCMGYFSSAEKVEISGEKQSLLAMTDENLDQAFLENEFLVKNQKVESPAAVKSEPKKEDLKGIEDGAYNMIFVKLKNDGDLEDKAKDLEARLKTKNLGVRVVTWKNASGLIGSLAVIIKGFLFGFVIFLFIVAIIIIVNTLSMAALERVAEIGMMRAVGAQKSFIRNMFLGETAILSGIFGGAGILLGILCVFYIPSLHITTQNDMVQLLYGGDVLNPSLDKTDILVTFGQLVLVTLLSVIYPVHVAGSITPLDAVTRD